MVDVIFIIYNRYCNHVAFAVVVVEVGFAVGIVIAKVYCVITSYI